MLSKGTNGEFGYLKSLDSDENDGEVLGHVPGDSDDIFDVASFDNENDAKEFRKIVNELGIDRTQALIHEQLFSTEQAAVQETYQESPEEILASISANEHMISGLENFLVKDCSCSVPGNGDIVVEAEITRGKVVFITLRSLVSMA